MTLRLSDLVDEVTRQLARDYEPTENGQVRAVPDERAIRYYTTLGLLERPTLQGRTAFYGARHVAQVVAIKRLQGVGKSLEEIQELLPTLDDAALARISVVSPTRALRPKSRARFWKTEPTQGSAASEPNVAARTRSKSASTPRSAFVCQVALAPDVSVAFPFERALTPAELAELSVAAQPLLSWIQERLAHSKRNPQQPERATEENS